MRWIWYEHWTMFIKPANVLLEGVLLKDMNIFKYIILSIIYSTSWDRILVFVFGWFGKLEYHSYSYKDEACKLNCISISYIFNQKLKINVFCFYIGWFSVSSVFIFGIIQIISVFVFKQIIFVFKQKWATNNICIRSKRRTQIIFLNSVKMKKINIICIRIWPNI